ncbi:hypothetical protein C3Y87_01420 [Carbonactinospora thermoautotrophica]|uniref:Ricin B lectin domain-containing protein n=1 Tax=Carbonactinospora thermoautotrophica TaxID=1469144 RepID=A0A132MWS2_9ACTN|nr:RICIN domain-containing protein [Carbonactinospora thermoautotrophica]KWX02186.1 hypothetical protein LI90_3228 [Carbonactinospora thermoautotrophica]MCX9190092.1 hypothetical protein [Carbonactinospora thermoautotrophica]
MTRGLVIRVLLLAAFVGASVGSAWGVLARPEHGPARVADAGTTPPQASATPRPGGDGQSEDLPREVPYVMVNVGHPSLAADVSGARQDDGTKIISYPKHGGPNQQWKVVDAGDGLVRLVSVASGKCMTVENGATESQAHVVLGPCEGPGAEWRLKTGQDGGYMLIADHSDKALDIGGAKEGRNNILAQHRPRPEKEAQSWRFVPPEQVKSDD